MDAGRELFRDGAEHELGLEAHAAIRIRIAPEEGADDGAWTAPDRLWDLLVPRGPEHDPPRRHHPLEGQIAPLQAHGHGPGLRISPRGDAPTREIGFEPHEQGFVGRRELHHAIGGAPRPVPRHHAQKVPVVRRDLPVLGEHPAESNGHEVTRADRRQGRLLAGPFGIDAAMPARA